LLSKLPPETLLYYRPVFTVDFQPYKSPFDRNEGDEDEEDDDDAEEEEEEEHDYIESHEQQPYITVHLAYEASPPVSLEKGDKRRPHCKPSELTLFPHSKSDKEAAAVVAEIRSILRDIVKKGKIRYISNEFLALCRESIWVFNCTNVQVFLESIDPLLSESIRSVVLTDGMLASDDGPSCRAWAKEPGDEGLTPFAQLIKDELPKLRDIALWFPWDRLDWYCAHAPPDLCRLLEDGDIQTLRILCTTKTPPDDDWELSDGTFMEHVLRPNFPEDGEFEKRLEAYKKAPDVFDVVRDKKTLDHTEIRARYGWLKVQTAFTLKKHDEESLKVATAKRLAMYLKK